MTSGLCGIWLSVYSSGFVLSYVVFLDRLACSAVFKTWHDIHVFVAVRHKQLSERSRLDL